MKRIGFLFALTALIAGGGAWLVIYLNSGKVLAAETNSDRSFLTEHFFAITERFFDSTQTESVLGFLHDNPLLGISLAKNVNWNSSSLGYKTVPASDTSFVLTFPHTPSGLAGPLTIASTVVLINNSGATAEGSIIFRRQDGTPMTVKSNWGTGDSFRFSLARGEVLHLETEADRDLEIGWVEVLSDNRVAGSGTFTLRDLAGRVVSEVGIGDSPRSPTLLIFVDTTAGRRTGFAVANPQDNEVDLSYSLKTASGVTVAEMNDRLSPLGQTSIFVDELFNDVDFSDFRGVLLVESNIGEISVVTLRTRGTNFTSLPAAPEITDVEENDYNLIFARMGDGTFGSLLFNSSFILLNNSPQLVEATVEVFLDDGNPFQLEIEGSSSSAFDVQVPAYGVVELVTPGSTNPGRVGWARVTSSLPLAGSGTFTINTQNPVSFVSEVGVPDSPPNTKPEIFVREQGAISTGVGLTNPGEEDLKIRLQLVEGTETVSAGLAAAPEQVSMDFEVDRILAERFLDLPAKSHVGLFAGQLFPNVDEIRNRNFEGRLLMESVPDIAGLEDLLQPISGVTLITRNTLFTSLPTAPYFANFGPETTFQPATLKSGSKPYFCFSTRQLREEIPMHQARFSLDKGQFDFSVLIESEVFGNLSAQIASLVLLNGFIFFTEEADTHSFYGYITFDGISEGMPYLGTVSNLPGGGVEILLENNSHDTDVLPISSRAEVCFYPNLLNLPEDSDEPMVFRATYLSKPQGDQEVVLRSREGRHFALESIASSSPQIDSVVPARVTGGMEVTINGSNLNGAQEVLVGGNGGISSQILEKSPEQLRVRLPGSISSGPIVVKSLTETSNSYQLKGMFAPAIELDFNTLEANSKTSFGFSLSQPPGY